MRKGYQTSEFYLSLGAMVVGALFASGVLGNGGIDFQIAGIAAAVLAALGYQVSRTTAKKADVAMGEEVTPGWKSTEFWMTTAAAGMSSLFASGILGDGGHDVEVAGVIATVLAALGYQINRGSLKATMEDE